MIHSVQSQVHFFDSIEGLPPPGAHFVLGLSGGVDSATTAAFLKSKGYFVSGVFLKLFSSPATELAAKDAQKIGQHLNIPVEVIDYRAQFEQVIIKPFVESYCRGETPSPCCLCNPFIKFKAFFEYADKVKAHYLATGHYAQKKYIQGIATIQPADDPCRDQSYFLFGLSPEQLEKAIFPLGKASKPDVRQYAQNIGLPVSQKPDSQDVCFLSDYKGQYTTFIQEYLQKNPQKNLEKSLQSGPIFDTNNQKIGEHKGIYHYTIGQRRGLGVSSSNPLYVLKLDENQVYVGSHNHLAIKSILLKEINLHCISKSILNFSEENQVYVQFRSTMKPVKAICKLGFEDMLITFEDIQYGVAPGQAVVVRHDDGMILGGGWLFKSYSQNTHKA